MPQVAWQLRLLFEWLGRNTRSHVGIRKLNAISPSGLGFVECRIHLTKKFFDRALPPILTRENT